ncbi:MAG: response regulator [Treponema sp.]|nr:response regulator [Treponema sp.]
MKTPKTQLKGIKPNNTPYRVLLIDDSNFIVKLLSMILTSEGFEIVDTASNGAQGLVKYKAYHETIDLVTLDITMPLSDGIETLKKILEFNPSAKVVMISTMGMEKVVRQCLMMGAKNFIVKPLERKKMLDCIVSVLEK